MGCCATKRATKVDALSNGQLHVTTKHHNSAPKTSPQNEIKTSVGRGILNGHCSVVDEGQQNNAQASSRQEKQALPPLQDTANRKKPKSVTFDIKFDDAEIDAQSTPKKFPRRLKKLEGLTQLTAEQLRQKQELAEEKRSKELVRKTETLSKHHRDLFQAREYERLRSAQMQMEQKFIASERNRQNYVEGVINKQREREKKAKKVRVKSCVELEGSVVHVDETYNSASSSADEGWPGEEQDERPGEGQQDDESSTDEFFESSCGIHLSKNSTAGFLCL